MTAPRLHPSGSLLPPASHLPEALRDDQAGLTPDHFKGLPLPPSQAWLVLHTPRRAEFLCPAASGWPESKPPGFQSPVSWGLIFPGKDPWLGSPTWGSAPSLLEAVSDPLTPAVGPDRTVSAPCPHPKLSCCGSSHFQSWKILSARLAH